MQQARALEADPAAANLATRMLERDDVFRAVLEETIETAEEGQTYESGRTVCGTSRRPLGPIVRDFTKVTLPTCPTSVGGTWHTHVTPSQLLNPENSLPDFANVAFGIVDVSIVAGAESSHVVVASRDRRELQRELIDALGVEVASAGDVADVVVSGRVDDPPRVREELYGRLDGHTVFRQDTAMPDLADRIRATAFMTTLEEPVSLAVEMSGCTMYELYAINRAHSHPDGGRMQRVIDQSRSCQESVRSVARQTESSFNLTDQVLGTVVGVAVGGAVERLVFG